MKDMRLGRTLYLREELEKQGSPPGGGAALLPWIVQQLDEGESDLHDPAPGDRTMQAIIERYPSYLKGLETRALSADEIDALKRDAEQSGAWMKEEIQRRKDLDVTSNELRQRGKPMSTLGELDRSMEIIGEIADLLEAQAGKCPVSRMQLVTWVTNKFEDMPALEKAQRELPRLDSDLRMDYMAWIHSVGKNA